MFHSAGRGGVIVWSIPLGWNEHNTSGDELPVKTSAESEQQRFDIYPDGTVTITKAGCYVTRGTNTEIRAERLQE